MEDVSECKTKKAKPEIEISDIEPDYRQIEEDYDFHYTAIDDTEDRMPLELRQKFTRNQTRETEYIWNGTLYDDEF